MDKFAEMLSAPRQGVTVEKVNPKNAVKAISKTKIPKSQTQMKQIRVSLLSIFLFEGLDESQIAEMIEYMFKKNVTDKEVIIKEGEPGENFHVIESGTFVAYKGEKLLKTYDNSGYFGELALMYNTARHATVTATSNGVLWCLDRDSFRRIVLQNAYEKRAKFDDIINNIPLFKSLQECERLMIPDAVTLKNLPITKLINEGVNSENVYIIESGEVYISKMVTGKEVVKKTMKTGFFGEESVMFNRVSSFSAKTGENTTLGIIEATTFKEITTSMHQKLKTNCDTFIKSLN